MTTPAPPTVIDLTKLLPHTHTQAFWDRFLPPWARAEVDGMRVTVTACDTYTIGTCTITRTTAAERRRLQRRVDTWLASVKALQHAITSQTTSEVSSS